MEKRQSGGDLFIISKGVSKNKTTSRTAATTTKTTRRRRRRQEQQNFESHGKKLRRGIYASDSNQHNK